MVLIMKCLLYINALLVLVLLPITLLFDLVGLPATLLLKMKPFTITREVVFGTMGEILMFREVYNRRE